MRIEGTALPQPTRLDVFVTRLVEAVTSRSFAARLIEKGFVSVDGKTVKPSFRVEPHHTVDIDLTFLDVPDANNAQAIPKAQSLPLDILFEDADVLVVNKPAGLVVHPGAGVPDGTLVNAVLAHCGVTLPTLGEPARAGIVHRLDRDTSGVMVVAKSQRALTELSRQFATHAQDRRYLALCYGAPEPQNATLETWHGRDPRNRLRYAVLTEGEGKRARLSYMTKETFAGGAAALVECRLHTGRTHQIRVQLTHIHHPLLGDALYGSPHAALTRQKELWAALGKTATRQMLHAAYLSFVHPGTGEFVAFESQPPEDFAQALALLRLANAQSV